VEAFLAAENKSAARRAVASIRKGVKILTLHPEIGRPVLELEPGYREWLIGFGASAYVVRYRAEAETIILLSLRHGRELGI